MHHCELIVYQGKARALTSNSSFKNRFPILSPGFKSEFKPIHYLLVAISPGRLNLVPCVSSDRVP